MSSSSADSGDTDKARTYGKVACGLNICGVLSSVLAVVIAVALILTAAAAAAAASDDDCTYTECDDMCCDYGESCCAGAYSDYCC